MDYITLCKIGQSVNIRRVSHVRVITVFTVFRLLTDFVCLYTYEVSLSLCNIVRSSVILLLPLCEAETTNPSGAPEFTYGLQWGLCCSTLSYLLTFCRSLFVLLFIFFWPLYCLFFFNLRIMITPLVSSKSS